MFRGLLKSNLVVPVLILAFKPLGLRSSLVLAFVFVPGSVVAWVLNMWCHWVSGEIAVSNLWHSYQLLVKRLC